MGGKLGVSNVKELITIAKLGAISVLQAVSKDGFQASDVLAPFKSPTFQKQLEGHVSSFAAAIPELAELDVWDGIEIGGFVRTAWKDVRTELKLASQKMTAIKS